MREQAASWPEHPGVRPWLPIEVLGDLAEDLSDLPGIEPQHAWFTVEGDHGEFIRLTWLADGHLNLACVVAVRRALART